MISPSSKLKTILSFIIVWTLISVIFTILYYLTTLNDGREFFLQSSLTSNSIRFYLWGALFPLIFILTRKFSFELRENYLRNTVVHFFLSIIFTILHFVANTILTWLLNPSFQSRNPQLLPYLQSSLVGSLSAGVVMYALLVFAAQAYLSRLNYITQERRASLLQAELVQAQLYALKMQLQPHFLFNTLHSISSLILKNPSMARAMVAQLGDFLRLTLDSDKNQMVLLSEELRFLRSYLEIEQIRFSERLQVIFEIEPDILNANVPHLILQPLVENSIKHGIANLSSGGVVKIKANKVENKLHLQVHDNGPGDASKSEYPEEAESHRTGLENTQTRLKHLYENNFSFELTSTKNTGTIVSIVIPLNFDSTVIDNTNGND